MLKDEDERVKEVVGEAEEVEFCGYKTLAANSFHFVSKIGDELYTKKPPIAIIILPCFFYTSIDLLICQYPEEDKS